MEWMLNFPPGVSKGYFPLVLLLLRRIGEEEDKKLSFENYLRLTKALEKQSLVPRG